MINQQWQRVKRVARTQAGVVGLRVANLLPEREKSTEYLGYRVNYPSRSLVGRAIARGNIWDKVLLDLVSDVPDYAVAIDIGCNIGASMFTMLSSRPDLRVIAYEPSPRYAPILETNVRLNGLDKQVRVRRALVGGEGKQLLYTNNSTGSAVSGEYYGHTGVAATEVLAVQLDADLDPSEFVGLIKVDTDGYETQVLEGSAKILQGHRPVLFIEFTPSLLERAGSSAQKLTDLLLNAGYPTADVYDPAGRLVVQRHRLSAGIPVGDAGWVDLVLHPPARG